MQSQIEDSLFFSSSHNARTYLFEWENENDNDLYWAKACQANKRLRLHIYDEKKMRMFQKILGCNSQYKRKQFIHLRVSNLIPIKSKLVYR